MQSEFKKKIASKLFINNLGNRLGTEVSRRESISCEVKSGSDLCHNVGLGEVNR